MNVKVATWALPNLRKKTYIYWMSMSLLMAFYKDYQVIIIAALLCSLLLPPSTGAIRTFYIEGDEVETQSIPGQTLLFINITVVNGSRIDLYIIEEEPYIRIMDEGGVIEDKAILIWKNISSLRFQFYGENSTRYYLVMVPVGGEDLSEEKPYLTDVSGSTVNLQIKYEEEEKQGFYMGMGLTALSFFVIFYGALRKR